MVGFLVAGLALLIVGLAVGLRGPDKRCSERRARADRADAHLAQKVAPSDCGFSFFTHRVSPEPALAGQLANVNASVSISIKALPSAPTAR